MRGDVETIARPQQARLGLVREAQPGGAGEQKDPLAFVLVVPETGWARLAQ